MASPELEAMFSKYRKVKGKTARERIGQAVGGAAETLRTGRSAAETFAAREPEYDVMTPQQKMQARQAIHESLAKQEQWAFDKALEERLTILRENNGMTRAALAHIASLRASDVAAAGHVANLTVRELEGRQVALLNRAELISTVRPSTEKAFGRTMGGLPTKENHIRRMYERLLEADVAPTAADKRDHLRDATERVEKMLEDGDLSGPTPQDLAAAFEAEVRNLEPGQSSQFLKMAAQALSWTEAQVMSGLDDDTAALLQRQRTDVIEELDANNREYLDNNVKLAEAPQKAYGQRPDTAMLQKARMAAQQGLVMGTPQPAREPGAPGETLETDPAKWTGMFGVAGVKPAGSAYDRTIQTLDMINEYPEHPPLQEAKRAIMENQEFKNYMSTRGYQDEQFAFKEMNREMRIAKKDKRAQDRARKKVNIEQGVTKPKGRKPAGVQEQVRRQRAKDAAALVSGSA